MRKLYLSILAIIISVPNFAQQGATDLEQFNSAKESIVCLQNKDKTLPVGELMDLAVGYAYFGRDAKIYFKEALGNYMPVYNLSEKQGQKAFKATKSKRLLVAAVNTSFFEGMRNDERGEMLTTLKRYEGDYPKVLVIFGKGEVKALERIKAVFEAIIYVPSEQYWYQSIAAQVIYGGMGIEAVLKDNLSESFKIGTGVPIQAIGRFGYQPAAAASMDAKLLQDSISAIVKEGIEAGAFPGAQVLVAKDGKVIYHEVFGYHTYDNKTRVKKSDIYDFASVSKISSALPAIMKWYGEGELDLDAPMKAYFPSFAKSNKANLSYRSMLAHNARLLPWVPYWRSTLKGCAAYPWKKRWDNNNYNNGKFKRKTFKRDSSEKYNVFVTDDLWLHKDFKAKRIYKAIRKSPLNEKQEYKYSGLLFYLLPEIVANKSGKDYEAYLKETFYHPLGAYTLTYNPTRFFPLDRIIPTERDTFFRNVQIHGSVHDEGAAMMGGVSANAGLFGSAGDLAKLMQMYMNYGTFGGKRYITEAAVEEFARCQYCDEGNRRGLGFDKPLMEYDAAASSVAEGASPASFGHSGYTGTFTWVDPENGLLYIFFCNRVYPTRFNRKIYTMKIRPRIHQVLYDAMEN
jgi:CubicO group peptidase (beta-lactamase class C family)